MWQMTQILMAVFDYILVSSNNKKWYLSINVIVYTMYYIFILIFIFVFEFIFMVGT